MTIKELIKELKKYDDSRELVFRTMPGYYTVAEVTTDPNDAAERVVYVDLADI